MYSKTSFTGRILRRLTGGRPDVGDVVTVEVGRIMAHDGTGPVVARTLEASSLTRLRGADRAIFIFDHYYPPTTTREAQLQARASAFAARHGIEVVRGQGIAHQVLPERGLLTPGTIFVGADSHSCTAGAFGTLGIGLGATDVAGVLASGELWLQVPPVLRIRLVGTLATGIDGHDLALAIVKRLSVRGALDHVLEIDGPGLATLGIADRMKLANFAIEVGAVGCVMAIDSLTTEWLAERGVHCDVGDLLAADSCGVADIEIDLARVDVSVAKPGAPDRGASLAELAETRVDQVFIGSCAGGRLEDLREAAAVLAASTVHPGVRLIVAPASAEIYAHAVAEGIVEQLLAVGATLLPPGCGACLGRWATLADDEVEVATQNRNFVGRAGSAKARIILASAPTAARCAITGTIGIGEGAL